MKLLALVVVLFSMGACTQYTCPTYSKVNVEEPVQQTADETQQEQENA
ncbi:MULTISPECIES: hypothetical protein [Persicobacter]|nr:hypothetical protein [Persicobacter sp. CCB-QB2]